MNKETTGRSNITSLIVEDNWIMSDLFGYGAFDGSRGAIKEISISFKNPEESLFVRLPNQIFDPVCPTLKTVELFVVSKI